MNSNSSICSEEDVLFDRRKPLKKREARSPEKQEVIMLASSSEEENGDDYTDDETATFRSSPVLDKIPRTTQSSVLSQLTVNSPCFATQPNSVPTQRKPRCKVTNSGNKRKTCYGAVEDSLLTHSSTSPDVTTGFLKLTKAPREPVIASTVKEQPNSSIEGYVVPVGRNELNDLNKNISTVSRESPSKKSKPKGKQLAQVKPTNAEATSTVCPTKTLATHILPLVGSSLAGRTSESSKDANLAPSTGSRSAPMPNGSRCETIAGKSTQVATATKKADAVSKKSKKMSFQEQVLHHMLCAFKPFTLRSLADDLKTTEAALNYVMLSLVDKGLVWKKDFTSGKGRVKTLYWGNHDGKSKEVVVSIAITSDERELAKREMAELVAREASIKNMLEQVLKNPCNVEINEKLKQQETELSKQVHQLKEAKTRISEATASSSKGCKGDGPHKSAAFLARERSPTRLKLRINHMRGEWKKRKEICMDFVDKLADGMEKKPKEVVKLLDIDTDETNAVVMPTKHHVK